MPSPTALLAASAALIGTSFAVLDTIAASLPGNILDGQTIHASGQGFYLGLSGPATYCPTVVNPNCPNVTGTVLAGGMGSMWVEVPGGQQVYVAPAGNIAYTQAHSIYIPTGSNPGYFYNVTVSSAAAEAVTAYNWNSTDGTTGGIYVCPSSRSNGTTIFQIYAKTPIFNRTDCSELAGIKPTFLPSGAPFGAWQYT